jgi:hypothetical protein
MAAPGLPAGAVAAAELAPGAGAWAPLIDHQRVPSRGGVEFEDEPLRAVLETARDMAMAGWFASVQVVVSPARGTSWPSGSAQGGGTDAQRVLVRCLLAGLRMLARGFLEVIELLLTPASTPSSRASRSAGSRSSTGRSGGVPGPAAQDDPLVVARRRAREAKRQQGPHLRATVRLVVAGAPSVPVARRAARELATVLAALATDNHVRVRVRRRGVADSAARFVHGRGFIASVRELAALWHLPHEPGRHGLPHPSAAQRTPDSALPRLQHLSQHGHYQPPGPQLSRTRHVTSRVGQQRDQKWRDRQRRSDRAVRGE